MTKNVLPFNVHGKANKLNNIKTKAGFMAMSIPDRFAEIGRIGRPKGLDGLVRFMPNELFNAGIFDQTDLFYIRNERSDLIPIRMEEFQTDSKKHQLSFFVKFDMITNRSEAEASMNKAIFSEKALISKFLQPEMDEESLIGYTLYWDGVEFGSILDVLENPAHPILEVKHDVGTVLIPQVDEFIERVDHHEKVIHGKNLDLFTEE